MNFALTEEQIMIRDAAQDYLAQASDSEATRAAMESDLGFDPEVWRTIAQDLGWCGLAIAEDHGGLGLGPVELMLVQEQAGYRLLCSPFFSTVCVAATVLQNVASDSVQETYLPAIAAGELTATMALPSAVQFSAEGVQAEQHGDEWRLSGEVLRIPELPTAGLILVLANTLQGPGLFGLVPPSADDVDSGMGLRVPQSWDMGRRFGDLFLDKAQAIRLDDGEQDLQLNLDHAADLIRLYIAAEQLGAAQRCLDITLEYIAERKQFGRTIASFQAIKHRCADLMVDIEATRSAVCGAAAAAASEGAWELPGDAAVAKSLASECLQRVAGEAIQLHGGVGFTWEYDPHLYFKRGQAAAHWLGNADELRGSIAAELLD